jgi:HAD superfamily hydrolase (TIGR01509 family)
VAAQSPATLEAVERVAVAGEIDAARLATPTPGADELLLACKQSGRAVVIVSNNAAVAIEEYLERHRLRSHVAAVFGRPFARADLMKPNPELVHHATHALKVKAEACVMTGDSITDIEASRTAGVGSIGYAKTPQRGLDLIAAGADGADAVTDEIAALAAAIRHIGVTG